MRVVAGRTKSGRVRIRSCCGTVRFLAAGRRGWASDDVRLGKVVQHAVRGRTLAQVAHLAEAGDPGLSTCSRAALLALLWSGRCRSMTASPDLQLRVGGRLWLVGRGGRSLRSPRNRATCRSSVRRVTPSSAVAALYRSATIRRSPGSGSSRRRSTPICDSNADRSSVDSDASTSGGIANSSSSGSGSATGRHVDGVTVAFEEVDT